MNPAAKHAIRPGTLQAIMEAAIRLLNVNAGATMSEIAARAGVGRATLHRHFRTRDDLVRAIAARCIDEMNEAIGALDTAGKPALERLRKMFEAVVPLGDRYSFLGFEWSDDEVLQQRYQEQLGRAAALVEDLKAQGAIAADVPNRWVVDQIDQLIWTAWNGVHNGHLTATEATDLAMRSLIDGLKPSPRR